VSGSRYDVTSLDSIERGGGGWIPIRRHFGIEAFGVNAWSADDAGVAIIPEHDEVPSGHEELYVVIAGHATFWIDGEEIDGPTGTTVFVRDPALKRSATTSAGGATILTVGGAPGEAFSVRPWETNAEIFPLFEEGRYEEARDRLRAALEENTDAGGLLYNLACAEARLGETDAALDHLAQAIAASESFAELAQGDDDFASIRDDPRFPAA
jgi:tetratricopeptide (TPR) repeat protein